MVRFIIRYKGMLKGIGLTNLHSTMVRFIISKMGEVYYMSEEFTFHYG